MPLLNSGKEVVVRRQPAPVTGSIQPVVLPFTLRSQAAEEVVD